MSISILHISDLHRDPNNPIRNDVRLDSLENDCRRYSIEECPTVQAPDLIVASGDIIQGVRADETNAEERLRDQYREATAFLSQLADRFVGGDRNRVVIVPGNHDVSAYHFEKSLRRIDIAADRKRDLVTQLFLPGSMLRWSWSSFELYEIADQSISMYGGVCRVLYSEHSRKRHVPWIDRYSVDARQYASWSAGHRIHFSIFIAPAGPRHGTGTGDPISDGCGIEFHYRCEPRRGWWANIPLVLGESQFVPHALTPVEARTTHSAAAKLF